MVSFPTPSHPSPKPSGALLTAIPHRKRETNMDSKTDNNPTDNTSKVRRSVRPFAVIEPFKLKETIPTIKQDTAALRQTKENSANRSQHKNPLGQILQHAKSLCHQIQHGELQDNVPLNAGIRSTVYATAIHWLYTTRINSIAAGDTLPNFGRMSARGLAPCALKTGLEYTVAMGIQRICTAIFPKTTADHPLNPILPTLKNIVSAMPAVAFALTMERFNQHLILGKTPQQAFQLIAANPKNALRGFPLAALGLATILTIQNGQGHTETKQQDAHQHQPLQTNKSKRHKKLNLTDPEITTDKSRDNNARPKKQDDDAILKMAALGSVLGLLDYTMGNAQLRGISSKQAFRELGSQSPSTLAAFSLFGALTLAVYQTGLDKGREWLTRNTPATATNTTKDS